MTKGYWIGTTTITDFKIFTKYSEGVVNWLETVEGTGLAGHLDPLWIEGSGKQKWFKKNDLLIIIQFPSKKKAIDAYYTSEYQELLKLRLSSTINSTLRIVEGS